MLPKSASRLQYSRLSQPWFVSARTNSQEQFSIQMAERQQLHEFRDFRVLFLILLRVYGRLRVGIPQ